MRGLLGGSCAAIIWLGALFPEAEAVAQTGMGFTAPTHGESRRSEARSPDESARRAQALARVGDVTITVGELEDRIASFDALDYAHYQSIEARRQLLDDMLEFELLARQARRARLDDHANVREAVAQAAVQNLVRERFDDVITRESISNEELDAYYRAHPDEFNRPEMRRVHHIVVASRSEAEALIPQLRSADARQFRALATRHSLDDESRIRGGDLRYFDSEGRSPNAADPAVDRAIVHAAFALAREGDLSEAIQVGEHWSVMRLTGIRRAQTRSVEESREMIRPRLWRERREAAIAAFLAELRGRTPVELHPERMDEIELAPADPDVEFHSDESREHR